MKPKAFPGFLLAAMLLAGCGAPTPAAHGGLRVLAAETFLGDMAQHVAGDRLQVASLLPTGVDPHEYQTTPQDAVKIAQAQMLIVNGLGYETWLQKSLADAGRQLVVVTASDGVAASPDGDPHMWMSPLIAVHYVENIRDGMSKADVAGASVYAANAEAYSAVLQNLDQWIRDEVSQIPPEKRLLVTNHDALGYFAAEYGFKIIGVVIPSVTTEAAPSARQMAELIDTVKASGAPAIFLDVSENQNLAKQIAAESGAKVVTGLYIETVSAPDGPAPTYAGMLKQDVALIVQALK